MKFIHNPLLLAVFAGCALLLPACSDEPYEITTEEYYVRDFINKYGIPDSEHSWSMAKSVHTSIDIKGLSKGTVEMFTDYPGSPEARLIARLPINNGNADANVPMIEGIETVYLRVKDSDNTTRMINQMSVNDNKASTRLTVMSAPENGKLPTAEDYKLSSYIMPDMTRNYYYMFRDQLDTDEEKDNFTYQQCLDKFHNEGYVYYPDPDNEYWQVDYLEENRPLEQIPNLKCFSDLYYEMGPAMSYKNDLAPIFDTYTYTNDESGETVTTDGVFKEGKNNIDRYYHNPTEGKIFDPNVTFSVSEEGPVTMQCIWRGTELKDYFGYYYYKEGEEPSAEELWNVIPKFIFLTPDDITAESNLTQKKIVTSDYVEGESGWVDMDGMGASNCPTWTQQTYDTMIRGRKYYLAYYGENYNEAPSYTFPTGIRIGYFLYNVSSN